MLRTRRLSISIFSLGCVFIFGAWLCMGDIWKELRAIVIQYPALSYFKGRSSSVAELLIGNAIGAYSVSFGFIIEYFGQKKEIKTELVKVYQKLRRQCFENIFCKENAYDFENKEVAEIVEYISENMHLIRNYAPIVLKIKIKIIKRFLQIREKITGKEYHNLYLDDDVYALIVSVIVDIYRYFMFIASEQMWIKEAEIGMEICSDKIRSSEITRINKDAYMVYSLGMERLKEAHMNRLVSRFPYNSKQGVFFFDKHEVYKKIYAINMKLCTTLEAPLALDYLYMVLKDDYIVKDKEILYDKTDKEIDDSLMIDEVRKQIGY